MIVDGPGDHVLVSGSGVLDDEKLRNMNLQSIETSEIAELAPGRASCLCSVRYRLKERRQQQAGVLDYHDTLVKGSNDWRVNACPDRAGPPMDLKLGPTARKTRVAGVTFFIARIRLDRR